MSNPVWLVADCGNTDLKLARVQADSLQFLQRKRLQGQAIESQSQIFSALAAMAGTGPEAAIGMVTTQSFSPVSQWVNQWAQDRQGRDFLYCPIAPGHRTDRVDVTGYQAGQLGADRLANLVACRHLWLHETCVVMDFGTACTVNRLHQNGRFEGGWLLPGWETYVRALATPIPRLEPLLSSLPSQTPIPTPLALDTQTGLQHGLKVGFTGQIKEALKIACAAGPVRTIATGGLVKAPDWQDSLTLMFDELKPDLTLLGLTLLALEATIPLA